VIGIEPRLLAMQIDHLKTISQNQQQLAAAIQALANATTQLAQASNSLLASNTAWRKDVLDKAIVQISAVPATLAQNKDLVETLTEVLAERLAHRTSPASNPEVKK
jgi:predicted house-cleaning NTP pyrophosphatase (Maf/HAM1 superfamily)